MTPRKIPRQPRGERRVEALLEAAEKVIADSGYDAATMSSIAERAGAAIGSLYQFFPNKTSIVQMLRIEYAKRFDQACAPLEIQASKLNLNALVDRLIKLTVHFVETHPALPALLDAPRSTRVPAAMRRVLQERFAGMLRAQSPRLPRKKALLLGTVTLQIVKALNQLYAELPRAQRRRVVQEFKLVLLSYFGAHLSSRVERGAGK